MKHHDAVPHRRKVAVCLLPVRSVEPAHESAVHTELARRIASLLNLEFLGIYDESRTDVHAAYLLPSDTLVGTVHPAAVGIRSHGDFFGGLVSHAFIASKIISHELIAPGARAPAAWSTEFGTRIRDAVLTGYSVFSREDAVAAAQRLLELGPLRLKPVLGTAGRGQIVVASTTELMQGLSEFNDHILAAHGLVLEQNLEEVATYSVGFVQVGDLTTAYVGTQALTRDNHGELVYGGSKLTMARGGFNELLALSLGDEEREAISNARLYDEYAQRCYPGLIASRRNYDVAVGADANGKRCCGVLEQSWRVGGASAAEIAALQAFAANETTHAVQAETIEVFGEHVAPAGAERLFSGVDPEIGLISKYVRVNAYGS